MKLRYNIPYTRDNRQQKCEMMKLTTAEGDLVGERHCHVGIGTHGIHALDHVLNNRFHLRIGGEVQHFILSCYIIIFKQFSKLNFKTCKLFQNKYLYHLNHFKSYNVPKNEGKFLPGLSETQLLRDPCQPAQGQPNQHHYLHFSKALPAAHAHVQHVHPGIHPRARRHRAGSAQNVCRKRHTTIRSTMQSRCSHPAKNPHFVVID